MQCLKQYCVVLSVVFACADHALAANPREVFDGVKVEGIVAVGEFPHDVQRGSIRIWEDYERLMAAKAILNLEAATDIARRAVPGKVLGSRLDDENGYLIWEVEVLGEGRQRLELKIDAGDGRLLAIDSDEHDGREGRDASDD